jgi:hypothetical protein
MEAVDTGPQWIKIDISQTIHQGLSAVHDDTFEPVAPK